MTLSRASKRPFAIALQRTKSSWPALRAEQSLPFSRATNGRALARSARLLAGLLLGATLAAPAFASSTPAPHGGPTAAPHSAPPPSARRRPPPMPKAPTTKQHSEFVVETNAKGQVTRVRSGKAARDATFNAHDPTTGNALQAFIRTPDDRSISGTYRLSYDYDPKTQKVRRSVALGSAQAWASISRVHWGPSIRWCSSKSTAPAVAMQRAKGAPLPTSRRPTHMRRRESGPT